MKKRLIALLLCIAFCFVTPFYAEADSPQSTQIKVVPDKTTAKPGETLTYTISFGPVYQLGSIQMSIDLPSSVTYVSGSFSFEPGIQSTLGFDYLYWTENGRLINGVASSGDYESSSDTKIATFKCKVSSTYKGTVQLGLKDLEFASCVTNQLTTSRFSVSSTAVTVKSNQRVNFPDVNYNAWYGDAVDYAVSAGLMKGYSNGYFGTSDGIQRQDFVVILSRLSGEDIDSYANKPNFKDVPKGAYYYNALAWAKARGVSNGYANGNFGVGGKVTREQIMTFLCNYAKIMGFYKSVSDADAQAIRNNFSDFNKISGYAVDSAIWAIAKGVISGKDVGGKKIVSPSANAQRCEVAGMFYNIEQKGIFK